MTHPTISLIVATVRQAGPAGIMADEVAGAVQMPPEAARKALGLQVQAGLMNSEQIFDGERYQGELYRMREGS